MAGYDYEPELDTGLGLIFRLNALWEKSDRKALSGDSDGWELILDRIFSNLLYREEVEVKENGDGEIVKIEIPEKTFAVWKKLKENIHFAKLKKISALRKRDKISFDKAKSEHYNSLMFYDIWLRKFMQSLKLYMKETEKNPSNALFSGYYQKRMARKKS